MGHPLKNPDIVQSWSKSRPKLACQKSPVYTDLSEIRDCYKRMTTVESVHRMANAFARSLALDDKDCRWWVIVFLGHRRPRGYSEGGGGIEAEYWAAFECVTNCHRAVFYTKHRDMGDWKCQNLKVSESQFLTILFQSWKCQNLKVSEPDSVRIWHFKFLTPSRQKRFWHIQILTLSSSEFFHTLKFWHLQVSENKILTLSGSDTFRFDILYFWHLPITRDSDTFRVLHFHILTLSGLEQKLILALLDSDTFMFLTRAC